MRTRARTELNLNLAGSPRGQLPRPVTDPALVDLDETRSANPYDNAVAGHLAYLAGGLGLVYTLDVGVRAALGGNSGRAAVLGGEIIVCVAFFVVAALVGVGRLPTRHWEPCTVGLLTVTCLDVAVRTSLTGNFWQTTNLVIALVGAAAAISTRRWFIISIVIAWIAFVATVAVDLSGFRLGSGPAEMWVYMTLTMVAATMLAWTFRVMRERAFDSLDAARRFAESLAVVDVLTGLTNRRGLAIAATPMIEQARRQGDHAHCLFLDVDGFKAINDSLGHSAGDRVLVAVADALRHVTRATAVVARWAGDEFVVVGPGGGLPPAELAGRIRARLTANPPVPLDVWPATISIGLATLPPWELPDLEQLVSQADQDMYARRSRRPGGLGRHGVERTAG